MKLHGVSPRSCGILCAERIRYTPYFLKKVEVGIKGACIQLH